jgi:hypothetical protein
MVNFLRRWLLLALLLVLPAGAPQKEAPVVDTRAGLPGAAFEIHMRDFFCKAGVSGLPGGQRWVIGSAETDDPRRRRSK